MVHRAHDLCVRRRVAFATTRGHAVWDLSAYPHWASPPIPAATCYTCELFVLREIIMFLVAYDDLIALMMILVAYALEDEPAEESVDHRLGRGA